MSALLHPIHGAREKCRPKHQVLILRCYPKYQKNVQEVKPNSSELSYLLYYASTRRTKLQKVGAFLEKKTSHDVWRQKLGNVQVTLQILTSIIEKAPRDLSLYAGSVMTILELVLHSKDANMIEESLPTFETYCKHVHVASLAADQTRLRQYTRIIEQYASFGARKSEASASSVPISIRWRTVALRAIRAVVGSEALSVETNVQLVAVMPVVLENLNLESGASLGPLQQRAQTGEKQSIEIARKRRMSSATIPSIDEIDVALATASETTADADKAAEEEVRVLAVRCLKQIFSVSTGTNRGQIRLATSETLRYIATHQRPQTSSGIVDTSLLVPEWALVLFEAVARWTPTQDRFVIVITTIETLFRTPIVEKILSQHLVLASLVDWLLRSDINLIGLSVMDVLLRLIQHMLLLLQLGSRDLQVMPQNQLNNLLFRDMRATFDPASLLPDSKELPGDLTEATPSPIRIELLRVLQKSISDLATHVYYSDQISDMITAIMARLKPSLNSEVPTAAAAINDPVAASKAIAGSANLQEDPKTDDFFSFATARVVALKAVKDILITANSRRTSTGVSTEVRSRVGVQVWEGTQWLLKDDDPDVRIAYVDAIVTWLRLETNKSDSLLPRFGPRKVRVPKTDAAETGIASRAVSNASKKDARPTKSSFLKLLHLAIYDLAMDRAEDPADVLLVYLLLWTLVQRLGVNAVRNGLPMILNLQNTVLNASYQISTDGKVNIATLIHGYMWAIADKFDFEDTAIGHEINAEVSRRKRFSCWFDKVKFPPSDVPQIRAMHLNETEKSDLYPAEGVNSLKPFLNVVPFVDEIALAYDKALVSPPASPPASPGRVFSVPTLGFGYGYSVAPAPKPSPESQLPQKIKDEMSSTWSRESCIAAIEKESNPSLSGSRTAPSSNGRNLLSTTNNHRQTSGQQSPIDPPEPTENAANTALVSGLGSLSRARNFSTTSSLRDPDTSSHDSTMRVSDLKRALAGANGIFRSHSPLSHPPTRSRHSTQSSASESMVSWNPADDESIGDGISGSRPASVHASARPATSSIPGSHTFHDQTTVTSNPTLDSDIPPVPKLPSMLDLPGTWPRDPSPVRTDVSPSININGSAVANNPDSTVSGSQTKPDKSRKKVYRPVSRAGAASIWSEKTAVTRRKTDLNQLLAGINTETDAEEAKGVLSSPPRIIKPPY